MLTIYTSMLLTVSPEVLDMHEECCHSCQVSRVMIFRWMHKLVFIWPDSLTAPFCDRQEDEEIVAYHKSGVTKMM